MSTNVQIKNPNASVAGSVFRQEKRILTLTMNPTIDLGAEVPRVYAEHKLRCQRIRNDLGGGGINVSRAIKKLGGSSKALYVCGGPTGQMLRSLLDKEGITHNPVLTEGWTRQNVTISEMATGQQYRFIMPGPELSDADCQMVLDFLSDQEPFPEFVVASGSLPPGVSLDFYGKVARLVADNGGRMIVDTSGPALPAAIESGVFLIKPSLSELSCFNGGPLDNEGDQEETALRIVRTTKCEAVVVSLGPEGILLASEDGCVRIRSPHVPVQSKVGAGDSMVAGITLALARGYELEEAVRFGVAAGAAATMNSGTELCRLEDAELLYDRMAKQHLQSELAVVAV